MNSGSYRIEKVSAEELEVLRSLSVETFSDTFSNMNDPENFDSYLKKAFSMQKLSDEFKHPDSFFYFLKDESGLLGYLKINTKTAQTEQLLDSALEIERIYIVQEAQGKGLGKALLEFAMGEAKARQLLCVWLGVWEKNEKAIAFYKHHGFEVFADHPFKLGDDLQRDLLMKRFV
ncbi:GNAT family N-acetyltransferase [Roseivirga sp.]|uniref:GNAT family N-acetyltransferase n=1 Tax=Roseivirga sp. TaxID=1964215 RepID=UPI003B51BCDA